MWLEHAGAGAARDPPQPAALVPHHPGHRHRRRRGDHDGDARQRRDAGRVGPDHQPGHQPADGAPGPAPGPGARRGRLAAVPPGRRARRSRRRSAACARWRRRPRPARVAVLRRAQLVDRGLRQHQRLLRDQQLDARATAGTFEEAEERAGAAVCVIGATVRRELFGAEEPVGARLRLRNITCEVIGLLQSKGQAAMGQDQDDIVVMPIAHRAAAADRQPQRRHAAGVDGRRRRRRTASRPT